MTSVQLFLSKKSLHPTAHMKRTCVLGQDAAPRALSHGELEPGAQGQDGHHDPADQGQPHHLHLPRQPTTLFELYAWL